MGADAHWHQCQHWREHWSQLMSGAIPDAAFEAVLSAIADGDSVSAACRKSGNCSKATFFRRVRSDPEFNRRWMEAQEERAEARYERYDDIMRRLEEGKQDPGSARILLESLRWQMARDDSRRFSDKVKTELSSPGDKPLFPDRPPPDEMEVARLIGSLLYSQGVRSLDDVSNPAALLGFST
jgi:hypothetical protein